MSNLLRPRNVAVGAGAVAAVFAFSQTRTGQKLDPVRNPPNTNAVSNINERFSKGGGSERGTPAVASPLGSSEKQDSDYSHGNTVAGAKATGQKSSTPGKEQKHEGSEGANVNAVDRKGQTGREGSHGNLRDIGTSQVG